jgi:hypothetical protein
MWKVRFSKSKDDKKCFVFELGKQILEHFVSPLLFLSYLLYVLRKLCFLISQKSIMLS